MKYSTVAITAIFIQAALAAPSLGVPAPGTLSERSTEHNNPHPIEEAQASHSFIENKPVWDPPHRLRSVPHEGTQHYRRGGWWGDNDWDDDRYDDGYRRKWWGGKYRGYGHRKNRWGGNRWGYKGGRWYGGRYGWDDDRDYGYGW